MGPGVGPDVGPGSGPSSGRGASQICSPRERSRGDRNRSTVFPTVPPSGDRRGPAQGSRWGSGPPSFHEKRPQRMGAQHALDHVGNPRALHRSPAVKLPAGEGIGQPRDTPSRVCCGRSSLTLRRSGRTRQTLSPRGERATLFPGSPRGAPADLRRGPPSPRALRGCGPRARPPVSSCNPSVLHADPFGHGGREPREVFGSSTIGAQGLRFKHASGVVFATTAYG